MKLKLFAFILIFLWIGTIFAENKMNSKIAAEKFVGTWKLLSYEIKFADGHIEYPFGKDVIGYIMYTKDGYMSVSMMKSQRENFDEKSIPPNWDAIPDKKKTAAIETFFAYCGEYEIKSDNLIIHKLKVASIPDWTGTIQERNYRFEDNKLTLSAKLPQATATLVWEHV
jgi:hypothetical protein